MRPRQPARRRSRSAVTYSELGSVQRRRVRVGRSRWFFPGFVALSCFLTVSVVLSSWFALYFHGRSSVAAAVVPARPTQAVVFVIDGASPSDFQSGSYRSIASLARTGVVYSSAWLGHLESTPVVSNAVLASGVYPWRNGVIGKQWKASGGGGVVAPSQPDQIQLGALDQVMESRHITPLASLLKARRPDSRVLSVGGVGCAAANAAGTWVADYILCPVRSGHSWVAGDVTGHAPPSGALRNPAWTVAVAKGKGYGPQIEGWQLGQQDDWVTRYALWAMRRTHPALTIINFPEIEQVGHYVPVAQRKSVIAPLMSGIDRDIGSVENWLRQDRMLRHTAFVVTSDQALAPVATRVQLSAIKHAIIAAGGQKLYITADDAAMIGLQDPLQAQPVAQSVQAAHLRGIDAVYYKVRRGQAWRYEPQFLDPSLPARYGDAASYLLWTMGSNVAPDVAVAYAPGTSTGDPRLGPYHWDAGSLGIQWEDQHVPLILAGAGIQHQRQSSFPARTVDIAPTLAAVLGLSTRPFDGVPLSDALVVPPSNGAARQATAARWLRPLVDALQQRAQNSSG